MKKKADSFFDKDEFVDALPLYSQLLSIYPKDPEYNFRYGVCNLIAGSDKDKSITYLTLASKSEDTDKEVFYYLGRALHLNYRFDEAITNYNIFKTKASSKSLAKLDVNRQIEMCTNGKDLLRSITDLQVIEKKEFSITEFDKAYDLTSIDTKILATPEDMLTEVDKKKKNQSLIIQKNRGQEIYFTSYGDNTKNSKDIYKSVLLPNFTYSKAIKLPAEINTPYDEEFPYITPDGKTLYFSSKGHNSMGGYDVYKSDYDAATGKYSAPVNLDFAINTPDDDIMYVYDGKSEFAFFASKRNTGADKITVYKIRNQRIPGTVALVKGNFFTLDPKTHQAAKIILKNQSGTKIIGAYNVNPKTGDYQFMVRQGETYSFTVESDGYETMTENVKIPVLQELVPIKQTINVKHDGGSDLLTISTTIETSTSPELVLATMSMLRERANLVVSSGADLDSEDTNAGPKATVDNTKNKKPETILKNEVALPVNEVSVSNAQPIKPINEEVEKLKSEIATIESRKEQLKADLTKTNDLNVKKVINKQLIELERQHTEKSNQLITGKPATENVAATTPKPKQINATNYPVEAQQQINRGNTLLNESAQLKKEAETARKNATTILNETTRNSELARASSIDKESTEKEIEGYTDLIQANAVLKKKQDAEITANPSIEKTVLIADFNTIETAKKEAITESNPKLKAEKLKLAFENEVKVLDKQKSILESTVSPIAKVNEPTIEKVELSKPITDAQNVVKANPIEDKTAIQTATTIPTTENKKTGIDSQNSNNIKSGEISLKATEVTPPKSTAAENQTLEVTKLSRIKSEQDTLRKASEKLQSTAVDLRAYAESIKSKSKKESALNAAIVYENRAAAINATINEKQKSIDSLERISTDSKPAAIAATNPTSAIESKPVDIKVIEETKMQPTVDNSTNKEAVSSVKSLKYTKAEIDSIVELPAYTQYQVNQYAGDSLESIYDNVFKKVKDNKKVADELFAEKEKYDSQFTAETNTKKKQELRLKAKQSETLANAKIAQADSLYAQAQELAKLIEISDGKLSLAINTLDKKSSKEFPIIYNSTTQKPFNLTKEEYMAELTKIKSEPNNSTATITKDEPVEVKNQEPIIKGLNYSKEEITTIMNSSSYIDYANNQFKGDSLEFVYQKTFKQVQNLKEIADNLIAEKEKFEDDLKSEKNTKKRQELTSKIKNNDKLANEKLATADLLYTQALDLAKQIETSDNNLQLSINKLDKKSANDFPLIYSGTPQKPFEKISSEIASQPKSKNVTDSSTTIQAQVNVTQPIVAKNTVVSEIVKKDTIIPKINKPTIEPKPVSTIAIAAKDTLVKPTVKEIAPIANTQKQSTIAPTVAISKTNGNEKPFPELDLTSNQIAEITNAPAYKKYAEAKFSGDSLEFVYQKVFKDVENSKNAADKLFDEKEKLDNQFKLEKNPARKQELRKQANKAEENASLKIAHADSLYTKAQELAKQIEESDNDLQLVINSLDNKALDEYPTIYTALPKKPFENSVIENQPVAKQASSQKQQTTTIKPTEVVQSISSTTAAPISKIEEVKTTSPATVVTNDEKNTAIASKPKTNIKPIEGLDYNEEEIETIRKTPNYIKYYRNKYTGDSLEFVYQKVFKQVELSKAEADNLLQEKDALIEESKNETNTDRKKELKQQAKDKETLANSKITTADSLYEKAQELAKLIQASDNKLQVVVNKLDNKSADEFPIIYTGLVNKPFNKTEEEYKAELAAKESFENVSNAKNEDKNSNPSTTKPTNETKSTATQDNSTDKGNSFEISKNNAYQNDIPLDEALPKGIIFKVQLGAFKRKVSFDAFGGIKPINGETSNTGMIRYTAGIFTDYTNSTIARKQIVEAGIKDAYIVAFCNGRRIDVNEARRFIDNNLDCEGTNKNEQNSIAISPERADEIKEILATQKNLKETQGLLFTVQVGVYKRLISTKRLYNLSDLYYDTLRRSGNIRYSHGIFNDKKSANDAKNRIVEIGIKDAFVIPYFNKRYVPMAEADRLIRQNRNVLIKSDKTTKSTTVVPDVPKEQNQPIETTNTQNVDLSELKFKVQLGVFKYTVPVEIMSQYLKLSKYGIDEEKGDGDITTYSIGNFENLDEATKIKSEAQSLGLTDAFVAPYNYGKKIKMQEALKMLGR